MKPLRVGILGYGRSGSSLHADAIERSADYEMGAVCDIDPERRRQARDRFHCTTYVDYREMLDDEALDLVSIVTRTDQHCQMTCDCLHGGVNVLVTKPWCSDEGEALRMIGAADETGCGLYPWLPARWGCVYRRVREIVQSGQIGNVFCVRRAVGGFASRNDWQTQSKYGGGYLLNWGPHIIDTAMLVGGADVRNVHAWMRQVIIPGDTEDVFFADMELANGCRVLAERTVAVEGPPSWYVQGDGGTLIAGQMDITVYRGMPSSPDDPTDQGAMQERETGVEQESVDGARWGDAEAIYAELAEDLRGHGQFPVTPDDALQLTRVMDAVRESSERNDVVELL